MSAENIKQKRIKSELAMLDKLPDGYMVSYQNFDGGVKIFIEIAKRIVQSELLPENIDAFRFTILLDQDFPFKGPQVQCNTNFTQTSLWDQRDLFINIVGAKWIPSNTLYEISKLIPEFISEVMINEASESRKFIGRFNLGAKYYIDEYFGYFDVWKFHDITNMFIDYSQPPPQDGHRNQLRYLVVTDTALMVGEPTLESNKIALWRGWNTLYRLHKVRREKDAPKIISFVWDDDTLKEWTLSFEEPDNFLNNIVFRMETIGVECEKKQYTKKMILDTEVTKAAFLKDIDFKSSKYTLNAKLVILG